MSKQEHLVRITVRYPDGMSDEQQAKLQAAELARGRELRGSGAIQRIWRLPGQAANIGIWSTDSATELHELIASLPLHRWMSVEVTALATHPLELDES